MESADVSHFFFFGVHVYMYNVSLFEVSMAWRYDHT
jgi:hypothetical protein